MAAELTPNYALNKVGDPSVDQMKDFDIWLNANWDKILDAPAPPSGTVLPTSGSYNVGDRFYKTDTKSIYLLVTKDANWGWYWRPIHDPISPWYTVPNSAMIFGGWSLNIVPAAPMQIALDNRGRCFWRGIIAPSSGTFARATSIGLFACPPVGIRPRQRGVFMLGHETLAVNSTPTSLQSYQGARIFIPDDGISNTTVRGFGGTADFNKIHLTGIQYAVGTGLYYEV